MTELHIGLTEDEMNEIKYVQDLVCQSKQRAVSLRETVLETVRFYRKHKDPLEKAKRARKPKEQARSMSDSVSARDLDPKNESSSKQNLRSEHEPNLENESNLEHELNFKPVPRQADSNNIAESEQKSKTNPSFASRRREFSAETLHAIAKRDQNRCTALNPDGSRCSERRWLDVHHLIHKSQGGTDTLENLVILCRAHHQMRHEGLAGV